MNQIIGVGNIYVNNMYSIAGNKIPKAGDDTVPFLSSFKQPIGLSLSSLRALKTIISKATGASGATASTASTVSQHETDEESIIASGSGRKASVTASTTSTAMISFGSPIPITMTFIYPSVNESDPLHNSIKDSLEENGICAIPVVNDAISGMKISESISIVCEGNGDKIQLKSSDKLSPLPCSDFTTGFTVLLENEFQATKLDGTGKYPFRNSNERSVFSSDFSDTFLFHLEIMSYTDVDEMINIIKYLQNTWSEMKSNVKLIVSVYIQAGIPQVKGKELFIIPLADIVIFGKDYCEALKTESPADFLEVLESSSKTTPKNDSILFFFNGHNGASCVRMGMNIFFLSEPAKIPTTTRSSQVGSSSSLASQFSSSSFAAAIHFRVLQKKMKNLQEVLDFALFCSYEFCQYG